MTDDVNWTTVLRELRTADDELMPFRIRSKGSVTTTEIRQALMLLDRHNASHHDFSVVLSDKTMDRIYEQDPYVEYTMRVHDDFFGADVRVDPDFPDITVLVGLLEYICPEVGATRENSAVLIEEVDA